MEFGSVEWIVGTIAAVLLLILFIRRRNTPSPDGYMERAHGRIDLVDRINREIDRKIAAGTLTSADLLRQEAKLYALADAQRKELPPNPEVMNAHRDGYVQLIEVAFLRVNDLRTTGGANIKRIDAQQGELLRAVQERGEQLHQMNVARYPSHGALSELGKLHSNGGQAELQANPWLEEGSLLLQPSEISEVEDVRQALLRWIEDDEDPSIPLAADSWEQLSIEQKRARSPERWYREQRWELERQQRKHRDQWVERQRDQQERHSELYEYERKLYGAPNRQDDNEE